MSEENVEVVCDAPGLNVTVDGVVDLLKNTEEEGQQLNQKKRSLEADIEHLRKVSHCLELEKAELDEDITRLKVRNAAYQKEHRNLRNSITIVKFQIEKIKESIAEAKVNELKALEDFEKAVDEITEKFRSGPVVYERKILREEIKKEEEKRAVLTKNLEELRETYENFNKANGLRGRNDESEELLSCLLPGSALFSFIEMTKTLDEVISGIKNLAGDSRGNEKKLDSAPTLTETKRTEALLERRNGWQVFSGPAVGI